MENAGNKFEKYCFTAIDDCVNSRRCFMTGEFCSKQANIQKERKKLHKKRQINAFVVMNFSNMSDVVYKWRLKSFVESLAKHFYIDDEEKKLYCIRYPKLQEGDIGETPEENYSKVEAINVIRADSDPVSNYVICNRVCQQMQIADIIIVDVSVENTNVFYEFGMAVALGKMILPICYSESFYEMRIPGNLDRVKLEGNDDLEHHIDCYPWRKRLFEYYGIRYKKRRPDSDENTSLGTHYVEFSKAVKKENGFTDVQYDRFPYHEELEGERIGKMIYETMASSYNNAVYEDNTLIVYTMDGFLNEAQAGTCIINYYKNITKQMREEQCFCGERVGVLVQSNSIPEDTKDAKTERNLLYNVGEVIHIGMNQATYVALKEKIKPKDFLMTPNPNTSGEEWMEDIQRFVKEHISNKGILIYPNNPVYVNRIKSGLQKDVLKKREANSDDFSHDKFFCLYHVMLRTLRYTNEIVVDISKNSLQALFWLGAAHGSDIYAITVQHEETNREREMLNVPLGKKERSIFDVAGLWTAILRSNDTEGFYRQLTMAQIGIERHTKLILKELDYFEERLRENLYEIDGTSSCNEIIEEKQNEEKVVLESYYRDCFWRQMLRYNRLWLYLPQVDNEDSHDREPRIHIVRWDMDAVALLSHYLSKRKIIGEYRFKPLAKGQFDEKADKANFICIGDAARPLERAATEQEQNSETREQTESLAEYIWRQITSFGKVKRTGSPGQKGQIIYKHWENGGSGNALCQKQGDDCEGKQCVYKGFVRFGTFPGENFPGIITQLPNSKCIDCDSPKFGSENEATSVFYYNTAEIPTNCCNLKHTDFLRHTQVAQLILWREIPKTATGRVYFRVALTGASGPATYGLASIFVDDDQKEELFKADGEKDTKQSPQWDKNLLSKLQEKARSKFIEDYCDRLQDRLREIPPDFRGKTGADVSESQKNCYFERVKYATVVYLNTVLYRHFLPFLSIEDENCICNGMRTYIASMMAACVSPFSLDYPPCGDKNFNTSASPKYVNAAADAVTEVLKSTLWGFRGIEAFYRVEVEVRGAEKSCETKEKEADTKKEEYYRRDTRIPKGIWEIEDKEDKVFDDVNCIFFEDV